MFKYELSTLVQYLQNKGLDVMKTY
jgi:hypothetical protein